MKEKLKSAIKKNQVILLVLPGETYNDTLLDILKGLSKEYSEIIYVTLNRPVMKILKEFKKHKIDEDKFYFIDTVTEDSKFCKSLKKCEFMPIEELVELSVKISELLKKLHPQVFILDSLHTMQAYQDKGTTSKFAHDLMAKLDVTECKGIFPIVLGDKEAPLTKDLEMFVDEVIEL